jgi:hypothetical protein
LPGLASVSIERTAHWLAVLTKRLRRLYALQSYRLIRAASFSAERAFFLPWSFVADISTQRPTRVSFGRRRANSERPRGVMENTGLKTQELRDRLDDLEQRVSALVEQIATLNVQPQRAVLLA